MNLFRIGLILLFLLIIKGNNFSQNYSFRFKAGYGTYNLEDIKAFHNILRNEVSSNGISAKVVRDFPPYLNFQLQFLINKNDFGLGFFLSKASTGGRMIYSDYSGELSINTIVSKYALGMSIEKFINKQGDLNLFTFAQFSYILSYLDVNEYLEIYSEKSKISTEFISHGIGFEPGVGLEFNFNSYLVRGEFGFLINYSGSFERTGGTEKLHNIRAEWWGFRAGVVIGFRF